jgi:hypothetical protein
MSKTIMISFILLTIVFGLSAFINYIDNLSFDSDLLKALICLIISIGAFSKYKIDSYE